MEVNTTVTIAGISYSAELGTIESASLGFEDHGFLTSWIHLSFPGSGQGFGGMVLGSPSGESCTFLTEKWIRGVFKACGVSDWKDVPGCQVYALREKGFGPIVALASVGGSAHFFASEISDAADKQRPEFNTQHEVRRLSEELRRAHQKVAGAEQTTGYLVRRISEAVAHIEEATK